MSESELAAPISAWDRAKPRMAWIVFAVAFLLRLWGIGWGLPNENRHWSYHPDEPILYAYSQQVEPAKLDFEPGFYNYGTLYLTVLRIAGDVAKTYAGAGDREWAQAGAAHLAGRLISAGAGAGTAVVLFLLLRRRVGDAGAIFGAALIAFAPGFVVHSRFQTVDVLATFFLALSAHHALKLLPDREGALLSNPWALRAAGLSGVFAGLSAGTKYTGILGLAVLATALLLARRKEAIRFGGLGLAAALAVFLIATPGVFLNSAKFVEDFKFEIQHTGTGHGLVFAGLPSGFAWHGYNLLIGLGPLLLVMAAIGLATAAWKRDPAALALGSFFVLYYLLIGRAEVLFLRYTFPLLLGLAFGFGWLIDRTWAKPGWLKAGPILGMLALAGIFGGGLRGAGQASSWMAGADPRDQALAYFKRLPEGGKAVGVVSDPWFYSPPFFPESGAPRWIPIEKRLEAQAEAEDPMVIEFIPPTGPAARYDWNTDLLDLMPNYVVFSSFETEGLERLRQQNAASTELEKLLVGRYVAFVEQLKKNYVLDAYYGGTGWGIHDLDYIHPDLWIWKRKGL